MGNPAAAAGPGSGPEGLRLGEPLARREQRGIISNGVNLSAGFNATTGYINERVQGAKGSSEEIKE